MTRTDRPASLTVYTDPVTGIRIALAVRRNAPAPTPVPWKRLRVDCLDAAVDGALRASRGLPAFACVLPGAERGDAKAALDRCLRRVELEGFAAGAEVTTAAVAA
ncbi:hypothetical protein HHL28_16920 [Aerophototrophica crusticola]|uniref:Uncharacterized protein n=1 Tax=Aerophototrophica crusticola TaxID=1709002 RepID=A0A858RBQ1_9PROT|nr:hypothetical protein HHL28_16920 [Rhodospirillaceae bacterium B3]